MVRNFDFISPRAGSEVLLRWLRPIVRQRIDNKRSLPSFLGRNSKTDRRKKSTFASIMHSVSAGRCGFLSGSRPMPGFFGWFFAPMAPSKFNVHKGENENYENYENYVDFFFAFFFGFGFFLSFPKKFVKKFSIIYQNFLLQWSQANLMYTKLRTKNYFCFCFCFFFAFRFFFSFPRKFVKKFTCNQKIFYSATVL